MYDWAQIYPTKVPEIDMMIILGGDRCNDKVKVATGIHDV